ncbi:hypothetical protein F5878DRAFT_662131 [Lentinula raphanica]|uniref:Uncharacterized protein n=1 Tax=Lentinula raphanica TaxID=153919 RepID=A0AA38UCV7_9AGAR|nr:hypothetical protein F5878DRAFT_662131 [Lentinula raphanica]
MAITGLEVPAIIAVARLLKSKLQSHLQSTAELHEHATAILNDRTLLALLQKLYELNTEMAARNSKRYERARELCESIETYQGARNTLTRYKKARDGYLLAIEYEAHVEKNTADALQKALREENLRTSAQETSYPSTGRSSSVEISDYDHLNSKEREAQSQQQQHAAAKPSGHLHRSFSFGIHSHDRGTPENPIMFLSADCLPDRIPEGIIYGTIVIGGKSNLGSVNVGQENSREQVASQRSPVEDHDMSEGSQHIKNEEPESSYGKRGSNSHDTSDSKDVAEAARVVVTAITTYDDEDDDDRAISIATSFTFDLDSEGNNGKGLSNDENYDSDEDEDSEVNESDYESFESEDDENKREEAVDDDLEA